MTAKTASQRATKSHRSQCTSASTFDVNSSFQRSCIGANVWFLNIFSSVMVHHAHSVAMKPQILFFGSAAASSKSSGKVIGPEFCFAAVGFGFRVVVLRDDRCRIPLTRS